MSYITVKYLTLYHTSVTVAVTLSVDMLTY